MKKILVALFAAVISFGAMAQSAEPNRLLIYDKSENAKGFVLDNVDHIEFKSVEGEVAANVEVLDVMMDAITVKVARTDACQAFKISCFPTVRIANYSDEALVRLIDSDSSNLYYQDFDAAEMTGVEFEPNTEYTILTLGFDQYGVACDVKRAEFTSPSMPIVGDPQVAVEEVDVQQLEFTLKFTPNADVSKFSVVAGPKGELQSQYQTFAPMFGFSNFGQMIEAWGKEFTEAGEFKWEDMQPNTEYEVFIQAWDVNNTMAEYTVYYLTTKAFAFGGTGTAEVAITVGDYVLTDWSGEMLPSQFFTFTPNDQAAAYRFAVYTAETYDANADEIKSDLCSEPPMPMTGYFFYEPITTDFQINPNTEVVTIAAAKNINGEWGPITELRITTPGEAAAPTTQIKRRNFKQGVKQGVVPVLKSNKLSLKAK